MISLIRTTTVSLVLFANMLGSSKYQAVEPREQPAPVKEMRDDETVGPYTNQEYEFSIVIPSGYRGSHPPSPAPQHGVRISLSNNSDDFIWVDGSYNAEEYTSPQRAADVNLSRIRSEASAISSKKRFGSHLGLLVAERQKVVYRNKLGLERVDEYVVALRNFADKSGRTGIIYSLGFSCQRTHYSTVKKTFDEILTSWKLVEV